MKAIFKYLTSIFCPQIAFYFGENKKYLSIISNINSLLRNETLLAMAGQFFIITLKNNNNNSITK